MKPVTSPDHIADLTDGDELCLWAAQDPCEIWTHDGALAIVAADLVRYDRIVLHGPVDAARYLAHRLARPGYRLLGRHDLISKAFTGDPAWTTTDSWAWMSAEQPSAPMDIPADHQDARWLGSAEHNEVRELLEIAFPDSYTWPDLSRPTRWAGVHDGAGRLIATAADGPSSTGMGLLAGVAVHPDARGQGLAGRLCGFATRELLDRYGRAALMVDYWNHGAIKVYTRLGYTESFAISAAIPAAEG